MRSGIWRGFSLATGLLLLGLLLSACSPGRPLVELRATRDVVTADGRGAPAPLVYTLSNTASVDLYVVDPSGRSIFLRKDERRPPGQEYRYIFDGTYPLPDSPGERRVLPDGSYKVLLDARTPAGQRQTVEAQLSIREADTHPPSIEELTAFPSAISPNFDGQDDAASITYRLTKRATVSVYVVDEQGRRVHTGARVLRDPGEYRELWDGLDSKQLPLPDGVYQFTVQATDGAGNVAVARSPVQLAAGGRPEARLIDVNFYPRQLTSGETLHVRITVRNTGNTVLRSQGPAPGYSYSSYDTYASVEGRQFVDRAGVWRVGVDWAGSPAGSAFKYPYRWGLGRDLAPGEETTVEGAIKIEHGPLQDRGAGAPTNRIYFFAGLIQENMTFYDDKVGGTWIEVGY